MRRELDSGMTWWWPDDLTIEYVCGGSVWVMEGCKRAGSIQNNDNA